MDPFRRQQAQLDGSNNAPSPPTFTSPFPPQTAQPPVQIPCSDPFPSNRDPFLPPGQQSRGSIGMVAAWPPAQGNGLPPQPQKQALPPPPQNGVASLPHPLFDPPRRRSLSAAGSPPQYAHRPLEPPAPPPSFPARNMPPPSPPDMPSSASSSLPRSGPRGPPTASPFAGMRDLAAFSSSHRPAAGMSISSILGGNDERRPAGSPHTSAAFPSPALKSMQPPSPARARSLSMRDASTRGASDVSPPRASILVEPRPASAAFGDERTAAEPRRDGLLGSPQVQRESAYSFRNFQPPPQPSRPGFNGSAAPGRPNSQPIEPAQPRSLDEMLRRDHMAADGRLGMFRAFGDQHAHPVRSDATPRHESASFKNGAPTSQPFERSAFSSPPMGSDMRDHGPMMFSQPGSFGTPMREDQAGLFRPPFQALPPPPDAQESIESRGLLDMRREIHPSSPPLSDMAPLPAYRNGLPLDRPLTFEEHQRMEATRHDQQARKESDGSTYRSLLGISPELNRRGRNSPLPQAVQGAQPQRFGPGGGNPGIKSEFGRMFSGLGSGVGSTTPTAGQSINGTTTPSRQSPSIRHVEGVDLLRNAVTEIDEGGRGSRGSGRGGKKNGRRSRDNPEKEEVETYDDRMTPSLSQRTNKRVKSQHPGHHHHHHPHHHHHHHDAADPQPGPFTTIRFPSNPFSHSNAATSNQTHHHHYHHTPHTQLGHHHHHHHHPPRPSQPAPRKPSLTITSTRLLEQVAGKPRKHLGSQLYTTEVGLPSMNVPHTAYATKAKPIPAFTGRQNCTFTVRVPRFYLKRSSAATRKADGPSALEMICKQRQLFGTEVYTDDSDPITAAVHSGWLKGDFGPSNPDLDNLCATDPEASVQDPAQTVLETPLQLIAKPPLPVLPPDGYDAHITVLILPPLQRYAGTNQHHLLSRPWSSQHDGMSFMVLRVEFVDEGGGGSAVGRSAAARRAWRRVEEQRRSEAAGGLVGLRSGGSTAAGAEVVRVGA